MAEILATYSYELIDNSCYSINCTNKELCTKAIIPFEYKGLPVISISDNAFKDCLALKSVAISNSITTIGNNAFYNCAVLNSIVIPRSVEIVGYGVFENCSSLVIYCEAEDAGPQWNPNWNISDCLVLWGYEIEQLPAPIITLNNVSLLSILDTSKKATRFVILSNGEIVAVVTRLTIPEEPEQPDNPSIPPTVNYSYVVSTVDNKLAVEIEPTTLTATTVELLSNTYSRLASGIEVFDVSSLGEVLGRTTSDISAVLFTRHADTVLLKPDKVRTYTQFDAKNTTKHSANLQTVINEDTNIYAQLGYEHQISIRRGGNISLHTFLYVTNTDYTGFIMYINETLISRGKHCRSNYLQSKVTAVNSFRLNKIIISQAIQKFLVNITANVDSTCYAVLRRYQTLSKLTNNLSYYNKLKLSEVNFIYI